MQAVVLNGPDDWGIADVEGRLPGTAEVVVRVSMCGICGTDRHTLAGENALVCFPAISGHEFVGTVIEVGDGVDWLEVGTRVAVDPSRSCGHCRFCREGRANLCPDKGGYGSRFPGGFAEQVTVLATSCYVLADHVPWEAAVLAEPLACVLHGIDRVAGAHGSEALVVGAGPIGVLMAYALRWSGWDVAIDEQSHIRAALARRLGYEVVAPGTNADLVVDATGVPAAVQEGVGRIRRGGTMLLMGVAPRGSGVIVDPYLINWQELTIVGSMAINETFGRAVDLIGRYVEELVPLVTHRVPLEKFGRGLELINDHAALKVVVAP